MPYLCQISTRTSQPTLVVRTRSRVEELPRTLGRTYGLIAGYLNEIKEPMAGAPFAMYHNMDMQNLDVEIGFPVHRALPGRGEIQAGNLPAGQYAGCLHVGPYASIGAAYSALTDWLEAQHLEPAGLALEVYLNDPAETPPDQLRTQVLFSLRPVPEAVR